MILLDADGKLSNIVSRPVNCVLFFFFFDIFQRNGSRMVAYSANVCRCVW